MLSSAIALFVFIVYLNQRIWEVIIQMIIKKTKKEKAEKCS